MKTEFVTNNRNKVFKRMLENSVLILFAGHAPYKRGDEKYEFSPDRNFYYVTGIDRENQIIMFLKTESARSATLYIERDNGYLAKWVGANMTEDEARLESGIEEEHLPPGTGGRVPVHHRVQVLFQSAKHGSIPFLSNRTEKTKRPRKRFCVCEGDTFPRSHFAFRLVWLITAPAGQGFPPVCSGTHFSICR